MLAVSLGADKNDHHAVLATRPSDEVLKCFAQRLAMLVEDIQNTYMEFPSIFWETQSVSDRLSWFPDGKGIRRDDRGSWPDMRRSDGVTPPLIRADALRVAERAIRLHCLNSHPEDEACLRVLRCFTLSALQQTVEKFGVENLRVTLASFGPVVALLPWEKFAASDWRSLLDGFMWRRVVEKETSPTTWYRLKLADEKRAHEVLWKEVTAFVGDNIHPQISRLPAESTQLATEFLTFLKGRRGRRR